MAELQDQEDARWDDVRIFLAVHRNGSLGAAAQKLRVDTSTVSRRLSAFEAAQGAKLFERTRDGAVATHAGEVLLAAAEAMEAAYQRLVRDATDLESEAEGVVRISTAPGLAEAFVAPALVRLRARAPRVRIEIDASVRARDLARHEADLALRSIEPRGSELVTTRLLVASWVVAGSPSLVAELGTLRAWSDVPVIAWDADLASFGPARWLAKHARDADVVLRTSHFASQVSAALSGLGVLLLPEPYLRVHGLVTVKVGAALRPDVEALPKDGLWLVGHRAYRTIPRIAAVWQFLEEELRPKRARR